MRKEDKISIAEINKAIDQFASAMKAKMFIKYREGLRGWDGENRFSNHTTLDEIGKTLVVKSVQCHLGCDFKQAIDVANYAMIMWFRNRKDLA